MPIVGVPPDSIKSLRSAREAEPNPGKAKMKNGEPLLPKECAPAVGMAFSYES